jgi:hypothetical protein
MGDVTDPFGALARRRPTRPPAPSAWESPPFTAPGYGVAGRTAFDWFAPWVGPVVESTGPAGTCRRRER